MHVSVLVVSYNCRDVLGRCLRSISGAHDVIVVDNASQDATSEHVREAFPHVTLIANARNVGFSAAVNAAASRARGDAFLLLNPDTELPADALTRMAAALDGRSDAAAVGFRQVDAKGRFQLAAGPDPTLLRELGRRFVQRRLDRDDRVMSWLLDHWLSRARAVPWVAGSALLVWRRAFESIGGFDERFFLYFEDIDFCLRLRNAVGKVYYDPRVTILHHRGVSASHSNGLAARAYRESQLYFWEKHRGPLLRNIVERYLRWRGVAPS